MSRFGRIDALVNNAAITKVVDHADLEGMASEDFRRILDVNVVAAFQMTRAVAPHLAAKGAGSVVNISSASGIDGMGSSIAYAASKAALNTVTFSLARALAPAIPRQRHLPRVHRKRLDAAGAWRRQI